VKGGNNEAWNGTGDGNPDPVQRGIASIHGQRHVSMGPLIYTRKDWTQ
jgi:hypothetical protein